MSTAIRDMGYSIPVPANSSRFFDSAAEARAQPPGWISVSSRDVDPYLFNSRFDASLISHDEAYCTSVVDLSRSVQLPTASYFKDQVMVHLGEEPLIVDIGCGQGEFVDLLTRMGMKATGYDPTLRQEAPNLHRRYWEPSDSPPADLYVMRCVLPHIEEPWKFLESIAESSPGALVLIEFQRLEWILENSVWWQLSHDHVNIFQLRDFTERYATYNHGIFSKGEWSWVLVRPGVSLRNARRELDSNLKKELTELHITREDNLRALSNLDVPLAIWGSAGKGIVLAAALRDRTPGIFAIDADPMRWGKHLEYSGIRVLPPDVALRGLPKNTQILVCNPNHYDDVVRYVGGKHAVSLPSEFGG